jgi:hypothetical protein
MNNAYSQRVIEGTVLDKSNSDGLPFTNIKIEYKGITNSAITDLHGKFYFKNITSDSIHLFINHSGYFIIDTTINSVSNPLNLKFELINDTSYIYQISLSKYNKKGALEDIKRGKIQLLLPGGLISSPTFSNDSVFKEKYKLTFKSQGCVRLNGENEKAYNLEVFKYLDLKYGKTWRDEIRKDVIGLKN